MVSGKTAAGLVVSPSEQKEWRIWSTRPESSYKTTDRPNSSACPPRLGKGIGCNEPESLGSGVMLSNGCFHFVTIALRFGEELIEGVKSRARRATKNRLTPLDLVRILGPTGRV